jgi:hypothetical protein
MFVFRVLCCSKHTLHECIPSGLLLAFSMCSIVSCSSAYLLVLSVFSLFCFSFNHAVTHATAAAVVVAGVAVVAVAVVAAVAVVVVVVVVNVSSYRTH